MNGQPLPKIPGEGQRQDLLHRVITQLAPAVSKNQPVMNDLVNYFNTHAKHSLDDSSVPLTKKLRQQLKKLVPDAEDFDNLLITLEGIQTVLQEEALLSIDNLDNWMDTQKEFPAWNTRGQPTPNAST